METTCVTPTPVTVCPLMGTFDAAAPGRQMEAVALAKAHYGPTPAELRQLCHCPTCRARREKGGANS